MDLSSSFCVSWPEGTRYYHSGRLFCGKPHGLGHRHGTGELGQWETDWTKASRRGPSGCRCKQKLLWLRDFNWFKLEKMINSFFFSGLNLVGLEKNRRVAYLTPTCSFELRNTEKSVWLPQKLGSNQKDVWLWARELELIWATDWAYDQSQLIGFTMGNLYYKGEYRQYHQQTWGWHHLVYWDIMGYIIILVWYIHIWRSRCILRHTLQ